MKGVPPPGVSHSHCKQRSIQTRIFNHQSASYVLPRLPVLAGYYFVRPEPLKITKSASSSTPSQEQDYQCLVTKNADKADGHLTRHSSLSVFSNNVYRVVQVSKYNRFGLPCKPPVSNRLHGFAETVAQSNRSAPSVNPARNSDISHVPHYRLPTYMKEI